MVLHEECRDGGEVREISSGYVRGLRNINEESSWDDEGV